MRPGLTVVHSVSTWLPLTETWIYNQVRHLPDSVESMVVCETTQNRDQFPLPIIRSLSHAPRWRYYWDTVLRKLRVRRHLGWLETQVTEHKADVIHSHFGNVGWTNMGASVAAKIPHVVTFYGYDVNYLPRQDPRWVVRYKALFDQVSLVLCEGDHMAESLTKLGCPRRKIRVHHLGVCVGEIRYEPRVYEPNGPLRVLLAASFREKKGLPYALEALGRIRRDTPVEITIIGDASHEVRSRAEKEKILSTISKYQLGSCVRMLGYQPHGVLFEEAYRHHVFLSPSITASDGDTEGGAPVTIIEMIATGMPVVSTTHCDIPGIIQHGVSGLLAPERDINTLVSHLRWLAEHPAQWEPMLAAGRDHVEAEFNALTQGRRLAEIYAEVSKK